MLSSLKKHFVKGVNVVQENKLNFTSLLNIKSCNHAQKFQKKKLSMLIELDQHNTLKIFICD